MTQIDDIPDILDQLARIYDESAGNLRRAIAAYVTEGVRPDPDARAAGRFAYPELRIAYDAATPPVLPNRAFARLNQPGLYVSSISRQALFLDYLTVQIYHLLLDFHVDISVVRSAS